MLQNKGYPKNNGFAGNSSTLDGKSNRTNRFTKYKTKKKKNLEKKSEKSEKKKINQLKVNLLAT